MSDLKLFNVFSFDQVANKISVELSRAADNTYSRIRIPENDFHEDDLHQIIVSAAMLQQLAT